MPIVAIEGSTVVGNVGHHAGHVIGYDSEGHPIYCSGHAVTGWPKASQKKLYWRKIPVLVCGDQGESNCACDGGPVKVNCSTQKLRVQGKPVVLNGDRGDFHGAGTGVVNALHCTIRIGEVKPSKRLQVDECGCPVV